MKYIPLNENNIKLFANFQTKELADIILKTFGVTGLDFLNELKNIVANAIELPKEESKKITKKS